MKRAVGGGSEVERGAVEGARAVGGEEIGAAKMAVVEDATVERREEANLREKKRRVRQALQKMGMEKNRGSGKAQRSLCG